MNYSTLFASCLFTAVFAFAQFTWETPSEDASTPSQNPPPAHSRPAEAKPAAPEGKINFDNLRGNAYNPYSTQGAASTVGDLVLFPGDINGQKFFYISPIDFVGYTAFGLGDGSALLGLDNSPVGNKAALILGYATPAFGIALNYSVSKTWESSKSPKSSTRTTDPGDNIGLYFSMPFGSATFYANGGWLTYATSNAMEANGDETATDYSAITANAGLTDASGSLNYDLFFSFIRTGGTETRPNGDKWVDADSYLGLGLGLNLGYAALQSSNARVIAGLNNFLYIRFLDAVSQGPKSDNIIGLIISPNILGEVALTENMLAFTGAAHSLDFQGGGDRDNNTSQFHIQHSDGTAAFAGLRYQKTNWALEAQVSSNPFEALNGENIFYNLGGFIYF